MGIYTKDLEDVISADKDSITVISETDSNITYKISLNDFLETAIKDTSAFTYGVGTISKADGFSAQLSSVADYDNISAGDILIIDNNITNLVEAKLPFPDIVVKDSGAISTNNFQYGKANFSTKDSTDIIKNTVSTGGVTVENTLLVGGISEFRDDVTISADTYSTNYLTKTSSGYVSTHELRGESSTGELNILDSAGNYISQTNYSDGFITTPRLPCVSVCMTTDQNIVQGGWRKVAFNRIDGLDDSKVTGERFPNAAATYDTTNYVFPVPYTSDYSLAPYLVTMAIEFGPISAPAANMQFQLSIGSGSAATMTSPSYTLSMAKYTLPVASASGIAQQVATSRVVFLNPNTITAHRYIGGFVWVTVSDVSIEATSDYKSVLSIACLG